MVVPEGQLFNDSLAELPPTVLPERLSWGHGTDSNGNGRSWATVAGSDGDAGWDFNLRLYWVNGDRLADVQLMERPVIGTDVASAPTVVATGFNGVPSSGYVSLTAGWRGFDGARHPAYSLGLQADPPSGCGTDRGLANGSHTDARRVIFAATAASGQADAAYSYAVEGSPERGTVTLTTTGPVREMFPFYSNIVVLDDNLSIWATNPEHGGDQLNPTPVPTGGVDLFGSAPVKVGVLVDKRLVACADGPARVAVIGLTPPVAPPAFIDATVVRDGTAATDELVDLSGSIVDIASEGDLLWVLSNDAGTYHLYRYQVPESATGTPLLQHHAELASGAAPIAIGRRHSEGTHDEPAAVAVVRQGYGVELRADDLSFISLTRLPGEPLDFVWGNWMLLGDFGAAELQGPNAAPVPTFVRSNAWSPGKAIHGPYQIATPDGPTW